MIKFYSKATIALTFCVLTTFITLGNSPENLQKAWDALNKNQRSQAREFFQKATSVATTKAEANLGLAMLAWTEENKPKAFGFMEKFYEASDNPMPYLYALWSSDVLFGSGSGKKTESQVKFLQKLLQDKRLNGTMRAMVIETYGNHLESANKAQQSFVEYAKLGAVENWSVVGTFENTSASGFNKDFGVLAHPEASAVFKNKVNAEVKWFKPPVERSDKWFDFTHFFIIDNAVMYAQTFLQSPQDQEVIMRSGCSGSMKIWVNDKLITNEIIERNCDLDIYNQTVKLQKGYNRILIQIAESEAGRANFLIRMTDKDGNPIQGLTSTHIVQPYTKATEYTSTTLPFFAEEFFENKIKTEPTTFLNYILLAETYLRNDKAYESRKFLQKARQMAPESSFLSGVMIQAYSREDNKTELTKEGEFIKSKDPESFWSYEMLQKEAVEKKDYPEAERIVAKMKELYGASQYTDFVELGHLALQEKYEDLMKTSEKLYKNYPDSPEIVNMAYVLEKDVQKNPKAANNILLKFIENNADDKTMLELAKIYFQNGDKVAGIAKYKERINASPYAIGYYDDLAEQYYGMTDYKNALVYRLKVLEFAPYIGNYWNKLGAIYEALNQKKEAIEAHKKAIYYAPTYFDSHKAIRRLENKTDLFENFAKYNAEAIFKASPKPEAFPSDNSIILINDTQRVVYPQGTTEEHDELMVKILTQQGIETWKEYNINYNSGTQSYTIEKAEVLKADGSKVKAEMNDSQMVFTGLQIGDAIHVIYRLQDYTNGMLAQHFNDRITMGFGLPMQSVRYSLLMPDNREFQYKTLNTDLKPSIKTVENFKLYSWEIKDKPAIVGESFMPVTSDAVPVLEVSTMPSWQFISQWYTDVSSTKAKSDFEVQETVKELFTNKPKNLTDLQKAKIIYEYIEKNISYLSVAFMQSGLVPQKASRTLSTKLGDCKDLSTLFVAMCKEVGVKANLVLVLTRDNGDNAMLLPSINFNHCIANLKTEGKNFFIELTDTQNSFGTVSPNLLNATALIIPKEGETMESKLIKIQTNDRTKNGIFRNTEVRFEQKDMLTKISNLKTGSLASDARHGYSNVSIEDQMKGFTEAISKDFTNVVKMNSINFKNLDKLSDSLVYDYAYTVKNEISEVAGMKIFRLPWSEKVASLEFVANETREFPFLFWEMFDAETMKETITLTLPVGKKLLEIPAPVNLSSDFADYKMTYEPVGDKLLIKRELTIKKDIIPIAGYAAFRDFFNKVVEADTKQYAFK
jgi:tetratricopeptide (TPR) repeat protein